MAADTDENFRRTSISGCVSLFSEVPFGTPNTKMMKQLLENQFFNPAVMDVISATLNKYLYLSNDDKIPSTKFRNFFSELQKVGDDSYFGTALLSMSKDLSVIIKVPDMFTQETVLHEMFVGICELNKLRRLCINFAYVLGGLFCSPILTKDKRVEGFCTVPLKEGKGSIPYVIYENINDSISLRELFKFELTVEDYIGIIAQILLALDIAYKECDFTHFDLHLRNIMIRPMDDYAILRFGEYYVKTRFIAFFIDYGLSHVKHLGIDIGSPVQAYPGVDYSKSNPFYDIHMLFMSFSAMLPKLEEMKSLLLWLANVLHSVEVGFPDLISVPEVIKFFEGNNIHLKHNFSVDYMMVFDKLLRKFPFAATTKLEDFPRMFCEDDNCFNKETIIEKTIMSLPSKIVCIDYEELIDAINGDYKGEIELHETIYDNNRRKVESFTRDANRQIVLLNKDDPETVIRAYYLLAMYAFLIFYRTTIDQIIRNLPRKDEVVELNKILAKFLKRVTYIMKYGDKKIQHLANNALGSYQRFLERSELEQILTERLKKWISEEKPKTFWKSFGGRIR